MLSHWNVLDLTDHRGEVAAFVLGELGAAVLKVDPLEADRVSADRTAPGEADAALAASLEAYNANKARVSLDPASEEGRVRLRALIAEADVVFDCAPGGVLAAAGIDRPTLDRLNPTLVTVVITPFGLDGPRAEQPASELTIAALGGPLRLQGTPQRPPVQISVPQVWRHAGAEAAVAAMVAHARMCQTGRPQFADVSAQCAMTWTMLNAMEAAAISGRDFERAGSVLKLAIDLSLCHAAADGFVVVVPRAQAARGLLPWLLEEGLAGPAWTAEDWSTYDHRCIVGEPTLVSSQELTEAVAALCARHPKALLFERGMSVGVTIAPVNAVDDLLGFDHLQHRGFWSTAEVEGRPLSVPGVAYRLDGERPVARRAYGPPPAVGGERPAVGGERPAQATRRPLGPSEVSSLPFSGLKVADFSWIGVGPITAKCLADHGATVVRIESQNRIDGLRVQPPMKDGVYGINRSNFYGPFNTSKLSVALDLRTAQGRALAMRMATWADVVIDSFTPGVMERLGLGPHDIRAHNPSVVTVNTSLLGPGGPHSAMAGYGYHAAALAGYFGVVGWPDLPPDGPWLAYTDTIGPRLIIPALLAALDHRRRTGEGVHLEAAQLEMALQFQAPEVIRYQLDGTVPRRMGNRHPEFAPQGVYPCRGRDEWCAITVADDGEWDRLVALTGSASLGRAELREVGARRRCHDEIDASLAEWTARFEAPRLEEMLRAAAIPAGMLQRSSDLLSDPQYAARGFYAYLEHAEVGVIPYAGHQYRIDGYAHGPRHAAPCLGEHTYEVLTEMVGVGEDELADAAVAGALE